MRDNTFHAVLHEIAEHRDVVAARGIRARRNLGLWGALGYPGGGGGPRGRNHTSDPTFAAVYRLLSDKDREDFGRFHAELEEQLTIAQVALAKAAKIVTDATTTSLLPGAAGCCICDQATQSAGHRCSRECGARGHKHAEAWQPIYTRKRAGGASDPLRGYCSFCVEFIERYEVDPHPSIVLWHLDHLGSRVPHSLIRQYHPAEFQQYHGSRSRRSA